MSLFIHRERFPRLVKRCPVSFTLIVLITLAYLFDLITLRKILFYHGALVPARVINDGEYHRLILPIFIHASIFHLFFNVFFGIAVLGAGLEKLIGSVKYALVFFLSALGASLLVTFVNIHYTPYQATIGASGGIYGVLGVFLYVILFRKDLIFVSDRQYLAGLIIINVVFTLIWRDISILGHFGGLITGFIIGFFLFLPGISDRLYHRKLRRQWRELK